MLTLTPVVCILSAIALSVIMEKYLAKPPPQEVDNIPLLDNILYVMCHVFRVTCSHGFIDLTFIRDISQHLSTTNHSPITHIKVHRET